MIATDRIIPRICLGLAAGLLLAAAQPAYAQTADMSFFVTSVGIGNGGNLGGLAGADNYCQTLAQAAGAGAKTWHAYLSTQAATANRPSTRGIGSARGRGRTPRAS